VLSTRERDPELLELQLYTYKVVHVQFIVSTLGVIGSVDVLPDKATIVSQSGSLCTRGRSKHAVADEAEAHSASTVGDSKLLYDSRRMFSQTRQCTSAREVEECTLGSLTFE
jgi:hypothetical protein